MLEEGKQARTQVIVLISIVILGSCLGNLSQTALNAMFSGMAADFGVQMELGQWVTTLYMLVLGITVPVVTYLMRRFPLKNVVLAALSLLVVGAAVDAIAPSFEVLVAGRALQAVSAGITMPMMISIVMTSFPRDKQATVMGITGIAMGFAPNIGPTIGGWMIGFAGWRSFFCGAVCMRVGALVARCSIDCPSSPGRFVCKARWLIIAAFRIGLWRPVAGVFQRFKLWIGKPVYLGSRHSWRAVRGVVPAQTKAY